MVCVAEEIIEVQNQNDSSLNLMKPTRAHSIVSKKAPTEAHSNIVTEVHSSCSSQAHSTGPSQAHSTRA